MLRRNFINIIAVSLLALLISAPAHAKRPRPPEVFKIQGDSQSLAAVIFPLKETFQNEVKMQLLVTGELSAVKGLDELDKGTGDALVVAMSYEELNKLASAAGLERRNKALTFHSTLVKDIPYSIIVNPANPVKKLSARELRRIFSGRYKSWDDLDGLKTPVVVVWGEWSTGASWVLADSVMDGEPLLKETLKAQSIAEIVTKVASDPNAIGIIPTAAITSAVHAVTAPELKIEGPIILVTVGFPITKHSQLIKLITGDGSKLIGY